MSSFHNEQGPKKGKNLPSSAESAKGTVRDGKVGYNTIEYTIAFLYSEWLYFPDTNIQMDIHVARQHINRQNGQDFPVERI